MSKTGFIKDSFDPRDFWLDELEPILGGEEVKVPDSHLVENLVFQYQDGFPHCVSYAVTSAYERFLRKVTGVVKAFSQPHLFYHSGGSPNGSWIRRTLNTVVSNGVIPEARMTNPERTFPDWYEKQKAEAFSIPFADASKLKAFARVAMEKPMMQEAIFKHGPIITSLSTWKRYPADPVSYWKKDFKRNRKTDNHAVLIAGCEPNHWIIFDSLNGGNYEVQDHAGLPKGYHRISKDYEFYSGYVLTELPNGWNTDMVKEEVEKNREAEFSVALNHYGKPRDFSRELEVANELRRQFENFKNQSVLEAAGKFWTVYVNCVAYGNYSYKDCVNDCYNWRRTGQHAFNLNKERN